MRTVYKHIRFEKEKGSKVEVQWVCTNKQHGEYLGFVEWYWQWKRWIFTAYDPEIIFSVSCLRDIADFMEQLETPFIAPVASEGSNA